MARLAINGFGRIGRGFARMLFEHPEPKLEIVAINDLGDLDNLVYLLKYDTVYGRFKGEVKADKKNQLLKVNGKSIKFYQEKDPIKLPWKDLKIDIVVESTGVFESFAKATVHLQSGAKRVVLTAPPKTASQNEPQTEGATVLIGINEKDLAKAKISSNGSCTTNAIAPAAYILCERLGIKKAILNTVHAYTATQKIVDGPDAKDWRRGRAGAANLVPSTTGAAISVTEVIASLKGLFDGIAIRCPLPVISIIDLTFVASRKTSSEEINDILRKASKEARWKGIIKVIGDPIVSSDIIGDPCPSIIDAGFTKVVDGDLVKILIWYDNEWGYNWSLVQHILRVVKHL